MSLEQQLDKVDIDPSIMTDDVAKAIYDKNKAKATAITKAASDYIKLKRYLGFEEYSSQLEEANINEAQKKVYDWWNQRMAEYQAFMVDTTEFIDVEIKYHTLL